MIVLATPSTLLSVGEAPAGCMLCATVHSFVIAWVPMYLCLWVLPFSIKLFGLFDVVKDTSLCSLCLCPAAKPSTCLLVAASVFSNAVTSLCISSAIPSSSSPPMNCSVSNLSGFLYLHLATFVCSLPILSWADSLLFLHSFLYCSASIVWLGHSLNILLRTMNCPFVVLLFSFSS